MAKQAPEKNECSGVMHFHMGTGFEEIYDALNRKQFGYAYEGIVSLALGSNRSDPTAKDIQDDINQFFGSLELELNHDCNNVNDVEVLRDGKGNVASVITNAPGKDVLGRPTATPVRAEIYDREDVARDAQSIRNAKWEDKSRFWTFSAVNPNSDSILRQRFRGRNPEYDSAIEDFGFRQQRQRNSRSN